MATLWMQLAEAYGARFVNLYGEKDSGIWYQALNDLSEDEIGHGLHAMLRDKRFETWPPNCTQFRHLCLSGRGEHAIPNAHQAFSEARNNLHLTVPSWSHPVVKFAVYRFGLDKLDGDYLHEVFADFSKLYDAICRKVAMGHPVPDVPDSAVMRNRARTQPPKRLSLMLKELS